jgi:thiamine-phosphate diphosphorylase
MANDAVNIERALRLYFVADPDQSTADLVDVVRSAIAGGVTAVQFRAKRLHDRDAYDLGRTVAGACRESGTAFIVNDRLDLALALEADGVHLGVDDLPIEAARRIAPPGFIVGYSPETDEQATHARERGASYLGVGPVFGTTTKSDAGEAIGLDVLQRRYLLSRLPVVGIGGITSQNAGRVIEAKASGVAVISAISGAGDPLLAAETLRKTVDEALAVH